MQHYFIIMYIADTIIFIGGWQFDNSFTYFTWKIVYLHKCNITTLQQILWHIKFWGEHNIFKYEPLL